MTTNLVCARCEQDREGLEQPPMGGPVGQQILANVCRECWQEWRKTSALLINHHHLVLGNPAHRQQLRVAMREFLSLDEA